MRISGQGVLLSLAASVLFVTLPGYVHLLEPLDSLQVVAHRVVWSIPMVFLLVVATRQWRRLVPAVRRALAAGLLPADRGDDAAAMGHLHLGAVGRENP